MIREFFRGLFKKKYDTLTRRKINFIYQVLLDYHERRTKDGVDIPAFEYATTDLKKALKIHPVNTAYELTKDYVNKRIERERNAI